MGKLKKMLMGMSILVLLTAGSMPVFAESGSISYGVGYYVASGEYRAGEPGSGKTRQLRITATEKHKQTSQVNTFSVVKTGNINDMYVQHTVYTHAGYKFQKASFYGILSGVIRVRVLNVPAG